MARIGTGRNPVLAQDTRGLAATGATAQSDALSTWNDGPAKRSIFSFVTAVTDKSSTSYVPPEDRIATFDQDGTLWVEYPLYTQAMFALDRVHALAPEHPEWRQETPFRRNRWLARAY